ncbi:peptidylprolyl isomerase [Tundrisphaera lichenicola]|uniref:peptidylprolyl isomerase n=1 Tax=Tundrisphaera lichenicola TaxID=2029860 RepID=UPI003EB99EA1
MLRTFAFTSLGLLALATTTLAADDKPVVVMETSAGPVTIELDAKNAPITVANFLKYVDEGYYDNLIFHRVIPGFMVQGGGFDAKMSEKGKQHAPIRNESSNGLPNTRGTLAMARTNDPDSATSQFFINLIDNDFLNSQGGRPGYAVFGKVTDGMNVVDAIAKERTTTKGPHSDVPVKPVYMKSIKRK